MDPEAAKRILLLPMRDNDSGERTVRGYLIALLRQVWRETDQFSGKKPFGSTGWSSDLYLALIDAGVIVAAMDEDGYLDAVTPDQIEIADRLVDAAICALGVA